jgi:Raf kinase inhibitor-like YbhB/YbcL family protein
MLLTSSSWHDGDRIPAKFAAGRPDGAGRAVFGDNLNPALAWSDIPAGTRSFALICHDFDVPTRADDVNQPDREVPEDLPRSDFFHWVLVDLPASVTSIDEGAFSRGFTPRGKPGPDAPHFGYDGPFPPFNDSIVHHYVFTLYALDVARVPLDGTFDGHAARRALYPHVLAAAVFSGTYTLNPRLLADHGT